jgi:hypothetical protein
MAYSVGVANPGTLNQNFSVNNPTYSVAKPVAQPTLRVSYGGDAGQFATSSPQSAGQAVTPSLSYGGGGAAPAPRYANGQTAASAQAAQDAADTAAYYQQQIDNLNGQNGRLDSQLNSGLQNYQDSFNRSTNRLNEQNALAQRDYNVQTDTNNSQYGRNRSSIIGQTSNRANALQRLLGLAGAGNSSAATEQAPYAAGLQGTQQLTDAQTSYGTNARNLDMNWDKTKTAYKNNQEDLAQQLYSGQNSLRSSINSTRASLLGQIQGLAQQRDMSKGASYTQARNNQGAYQAQINSLLDSIAGLGRQYANPVVSTGDIKFDVPSLSQYNLKSGTAPISQSNPGTSSVDPVFAPLLNQQRDQFGNLIS